MTLVSRAQANAAQVCRASTTAAQGFHPGRQFVECAFPLKKDFGIRIIPDFITEAEESLLDAFCSRLLRAKPLEVDHFDSVIRNYRETQHGIKNLCDAGRAVIARALGEFPADAGPPMPSFHAIELSPSGVIDAHVDSVKFSGGVVAGLCCRSDAVMLLTPDADAAAQGLVPTAPAVPPGSPAPVITLFLPRRSLYLLTGEARYGWGHAVPLAGTFQGQAVARAPTGRLSLMLRDELSQSLK